MTTLNNERSYILYSEFFIYRVSKNLARIRKSVTAISQVRTSK